MLRRIYCDMPVLRDRLFLDIVSKREFMEKMPNYELLISKESNGKASVFLEIN